MPDWGRISVLALVPVLGLALVRALHGTWAGALIAAGAFAAAILLGFFEQAPHRRERRWISYYSFAFGTGWVVAEYLSSATSLGSFAAYALFWSIGTGTLWLVFNIRDERKKVRHG